MGDCQDHDMHMYVDQEFMVENKILLLQDKPSTSLTNPEVIIPTTTAPSSSQIPPPIVPPTTTNSATTPPIFILPPPIVLSINTTTIIFLPTIVPPTTTISAPTSPLSIVLLCLPSQIQVTTSLSRQTLSEFVLSNETREGDDIDYDEKNMIFMRILHHVMRMKQNEKRLEGWRITGVVIILLRMRRVLTWGVIVLGLGLEIQRRIILMTMINLIVLILKGCLKILARDKGMHGQTSRVEERRSKLQQPRQQPQI